MSVCQVRESISNYFNNFIVENGVLIKYIGADEFVNIPENITSIGEGAFGNCDKIETIIMSEGVTSIGDSAFAGCRSLREITLPENITSIGEGAFGNCDKIETIIMSEGVTSIGDEAFAGCRSLMGITLPESLTSIGQYAFSHCERLESIFLPGGVKKIGFRIFSDCYKLREITISERMKELDMTLFSNKIVNRYYGLETLNITLRNKNIVFINHATGDDCCVDLIIRKKHHSIYAPRSGCNCVLNYIHNEKKQSIFAPMLCYKNREVTYNEIVYGEDFCNSLIKSKFSLADKSRYLIDRIKINPDINESVAKYINKNKFRILKNYVDANFVEIVSLFYERGLLTKDNIKKAIEYVLELEKTELVTELLNLLGKM